MIGKSKYLYIKKYFKTSLRLFMVFLVSSTNLNAQKKDFTFSTGFSFNSRIIDDRNTTLSTQELVAARELEIPRLSYDINISYLHIRESGARKFEYGVSYQRLLIGTKIFLFPDSLVNSTPQYPFVKYIVQQQQFSGYFQHYFHLNSSLNNHFLFFRTDVIFNYRNYIIRKKNYDINNNLAITGKGGGDIQKFHPIDLKISLGGTFPILFKTQHQVWLQYFIGGYLRSYNIFGKGFGGYLIFDKDTSGYMWNAGIRIQYLF